jgi:superfamily II DNA helicase RecQ
VNSALWYSVSRKKQLEILRRAVLEVEDDDMRDFFLVCLSVTCKKLSYADPAISVPVRLRARAGRTVAANEAISQRLNRIDSADHLEEFGNVCLANIQRVARTNSEFSERSAARFVGNDARCLVDDDGDSLASGTVDLVITSPPYGSAQKYVRSMSLSLNWLGLASPQQLSAIEQKTIGREHLPQRVAVAVAEESVKFSRSFEMFLNKIAKVHPLRARINRTYLTELRNSLREIARAMPVTLDELRQVSGVGEKKLETYGEQLIALVSGET